MAASRSDTFLRNVFNIHEGELPKTALMFFYQFAAVGAFVIGRITATTLLVEWDREMLAHMYYMAPLSVSVAAYIYSRVADKLRRDRLILITTSILVVVLLVAGFEGRLLPPNIYHIGLYILVEVMGMLLMVQFWTFANDVIDSRQGKRLLGTIGTGGVLASIICGQIVRRSTQVLGIPALLFLAAGGLCTVLICVYLLGRQNRESLTAALLRPKKTSKKKIAVRKDSSRILSSTYLKLLAVMVGATFLTTTLIDYQWKIVAKSQLPDPVAYAGYMGNVFTVAGALSFFFQLFATRRILKYFGVFAGLLFLPIGIATGSLVNLVWPTLIGVTLAKGSEITFRYTITDSTIALLYLPIPAHRRGQVKAFIDGMVKNWALAASGLVLAFVFTRIFPDPQRLSLVALAYASVWFVVLFGIKSEYLDTLLSSLKGKSLDLNDATLNVTDESTAKAVSKALLADDEGQVLRALDILPQLRELRFDDELEQLLRHPSNTVQLEAVRQIGRVGGVRHAGALKQLFEDDSVDVRAAAIDAYSAIGREKAIRDVTPFLEDESPAIKSAAIVGLIKYGGLDGVLCAAEELKTLVAHPEPRMRQHAARVLGAIGVRNFYQPLLGLLSDPQRSVQLAAIAAAGSMRSPELIPALILKLRDRATIHAATEALAEYGPGVEPLLGKVLRFPGEHLQVRSAVPDILARVGTQAAVDVLEASLGTDEDNPALRFRVHRALARIFHRNPGLRIERNRVNAAIVKELRLIYEEMQRSYDLGETAKAELLADALGNRQRVMLEGSFHLLGVIYPEGRMETVYSNLHSATPALRANALEVIDNMVEKGLREHIINIVEPRPLEERIQVAAELEDLEPRSHDERLVELLRQNDPWVEAATIQAITREGAPPTSPEVLEQLESLLGSDDPLVRQTVLWSLAKMAPEQGTVREALQRHAGEIEQDAAVRELAADLVQKLAIAPASPPGAEAMASGDS